MAKGDYPTGALVEVMREYKADGGSPEVYGKAKSELKNLLLCLVKLENAQHHVQADATPPTVSNPSDQSA